MHTCKLKTCIRERLRFLVPLYLVRFFNATLVSLLLTSTGWSIEDTPDPLQLKDKCLQDQPSACNDLGSLYLTGQAGLNEDATTARSYFQRACSLHFALGCMNLATLNVNALGGSQNLMQAALLYENSCQLGETRGCSAAGFMYATGTGITSNPEHGKRLLDKACKSDDAPGCLYLGALFAQQKDWEAALVAYKKACTLGDGESCNILFSLYSTDSHIKGDNSLALQYVKRSCELNYAQGCNNEGAVYLLGRLVDKDPEHALTCFQIACENMNMQGCYNAATLLEERGDTSAAAKVYDKACNLGSEKACSAVQKLKAD